MKVKYYNLHQFAATSVRQLQILPCMFYVPSILSPNFVLHFSACGRQLFITSRKNSQVRFCLIPVYSPLLKEEGRALQILAFEEKEDILHFFYRKGRVSRKGGGLSCSMQQIPALFPFPFSKRHCRTWLLTENPLLFGRKR